QDTPMPLAAPTQIGAEPANMPRVIAFTAQDMTAAGGLHAVATTDVGTGGLVQLTSCTLNVPGSGAIKSSGGAGMNLLQASGQMTIGGLLKSFQGENRLEYLNPAKPPIISGAASIVPTQDCAPATGCLHSSLAS